MLLCDVASVNFTYTNDPEELLGFDGTFVGFGDGGLDGKDVGVEEGKGDGV